VSLQLSVQLDRLLTAVSHSHAGACQAACATERTPGACGEKRHNDKSPIEVGVVHE